MSLTWAALDLLKATVLGLPRSVTLPSKSASARLAERLGVSAAIAQPPEAVLEALRTRLASAVRNGGFSDLSRRDIRDAPWVMWASTKPLATSHRLLDAVFAEAEISSRALRNLVEAWLRYYAPDAPGITAAGENIARLLPRHNADRRLNLWWAAHQEFALFDSRRGPVNLAGAVLGKSDDVRLVLARAGFDDSIRASGGYFRVVLRAALAKAPNLLRDRVQSKHVNRLLAMLAPDGNLRFGRELQGEVGRALLDAWCDGGALPNAEFRDAVRDFLLLHLKDPRLQPANWMAVGEPHTSVMRQWLARASLKAFFELISEHALDQQWRYRQAFWSACLEQGAIEDAWLALGARVHWSARAISDLRGAFGRLEGGAAVDQSVLLMRIGPLTLCEWSHNGKLRAWPSNWQNAPKLHRAVYRRDDLTGKGLPFPASSRYGSRGSSDGFGLSHMGSDNSRWQGSVAELLARRTNVSLTEHDWRPR